MQPFGKNNIHIEKEFSSVDDLLRLFYRYDLLAVPVGSKFSEIEGFLLKSDILRELVESSVDIKDVKGFIQRKKRELGREEIKKLFHSTNTVPLIHPDGYILTFWNKQILLGEEEKKDSPLCWFMSLILENFPYGILCTSEEGKIIFLNTKIMDFFPFLKSENILDKKISTWFGDIVPKEKKEQRILIKAKEQKFSLTILPIYYKKNFVFFLFLFEQLEKRD
jgi:PAS domain-containing protein